VAVYALDTFTAVQLLAFNHWSSEISPAIPINITKWIFAGCIILSFINLAYEYARAYRVIKRNAVAESYLDTLAVRLQSIRMGQNGHGWRRFLVFAELTRSKKGAEYIALFTYFSFQGKCRIHIPPIVFLLTTFSVDSYNLLLRSTTSRQCLDSLFCLYRKARWSSGRRRLLVATVFQ
jgi:hypothetical protein